MQARAPAQGLSVNVVYGVLVANVPTPLTRDGRVALREAVLAGPAAAEAFLEPEAWA